MKVTVTDAATGYLQNMLNKTGKEYLKFDIGASTCCDYIFTIRPEDKTDRDHVMEADGFKFLIHDEIKDVYESANIDYVSEGFSMGLKVELG